MRQFGILSTSLWRSRRFRDLSGDLPKMAYIYLHTSRHGNSAGAFVIPPALAALDMDGDANAIRDAYEELSAARLIRYDPDEEIVQIRGFFRFNSIKSRKHLAGPMRVIREGLPSSPARDAAAAEMVIDLYDRAKAWDAEIDARGGFMDAAAGLVRDFGLAEMLASDDFGVTHHRLAEMLSDLQIPFPITLSDNLMHNRTDTKDKDKTIDKTKTTDTTTDTTKTKTTGGKPPERGTSAESRSAPPSPPADGGRSGRKQTPQQISESIAHLRKAAKG